MHAQDDTEPAGTHPAQPSWVGHSRMSTSCKAVLDDSWCGLPSSVPECLSGERCLEPNGVLVGFTQLSCLLASAMLADSLAGSGLGVNS